MPLSFNQKYNCTLTKELRGNRLSKPSLSLQHPLPKSTRTETEINPSASLAYPSENAGGTVSFILAPVLQLPPAFGSAYVGETFSCTLCANNELSIEQADPKRISGVRIEAEMKTPTATIALLPPRAIGTKGEDESDPDKSEEEAMEKLEEQKVLDILAPAASLQKLISYHLKEEGSHVLSVTVTYSETGASSGRVRTFRKLYQFVSKPCMVVRTKTGVLPDKIVGDKRKKKWALEAQLENVGEDGIVLEVSAKTKFLSPHRISMANDKSDCFSGS